MSLDKAGGGRHHGYPVDLHLEQVGGGDSAQLSEAANGTAKEGLEEAMSSVLDKQLTASGPCNTKEE